MFSESFPKLRIVVLHSFYDSFEDPMAEALLPEVLALKIRGYLHEYDYGALPVDTTDIIGSHFMVCEERGKEFTPLTAFKSISSDKCNAHNVHFPAVTVLGSINLPQHRECVTSVLEKAARKNRSVLYGSSWTVKPEIRMGNRELAKHLRDLFVAMNVFYYDETPGAELVTLGTLRFKTEALFHKALGYQPLVWNDQELPPIRHAFLGGEPMVLMHSYGIPASARPLAEPFKQMWENRIVIERNPVKASKKAA